MSTISPPPLDDRLPDALPVETAPPPAGFDSSQLILRLFLVSLSMAFGAVLAFYFIMRSRISPWPPPGTPALPRGLWLSTVLIVASSFTMHAAVRAVRQDRQTALRFAALSTLVLALGFLVSQTFNWVLAVAAKMPPGLNMFAITFYLLTGLHALHIAAGLIPLGIVTVRAFLGRYTSAHSAGVRQCATFWHFVDVVWLVIFAALQLGR